MAIMRYAVAKLVEEYKVTIEKDEQTGKVLSEEWKDKNGSYHHPEYGVPAVRGWDLETGKLTKATWYKDGEINRDNDKPARIIIDPRTDILTFEQYFKNGTIHRDNGPAHIERDPATGKAIWEEWLENGQRHRPDNLPALISRNPMTLIVTSEHYTKKRLLHRTDGPAYIVRDEQTGEVLEEEYYVNGEQLAELPGQIDP